MTREEAIKSFEEENKDFEEIFKRYGYQMSHEEVSAVKESIERNNVAISVLSEEDNTMEWISAKVGKLFPSNDYKCSKCGNILNFNGVNCGRGDANFCPNCGRKAVKK